VILNASAAKRQRARRLLVALNWLLALALVVLLGLLLAMFREPEVKYPPVSGIQPERVIYGPGVGVEPLFNRPMGAAFGNDGQIYVVDSGNNRVVVFDKNGRYLVQFGGLGVAKPAPGGTYTWGPGRFNYPTDIAIDEDGHLYVADFRNDQIQVFDEIGRFLRVFPDRNKKVGKGGSGQGGTGIAATSLCVRGGRVYVTDKYQVLVFTTDGKLLNQFGKPGMGATDLNHPNGIAVAPSSAVVVSDSNNNRLVGLSPVGKPLWTLGRPSAFDLSQVVDAFQLPRGLTLANNGNLVVADSLGSQLIEVSMQGELLNTFGKRGDAPGEFNFPTDVAASGNRLLVTEKGNNRVQVVTLGAK